ncbi:MAG: hypothetical protein HYU99_08235 [Deltaproteobacteria bacterium]|nr:hypothetical protein [Deltaproteobacteria bacterium]
MVLIRLWIVIADRGQGILSSLKRVLPSLKDDQEALETAFEKKLSGRAPEKRGNGLKFVRGVIHGNSSKGLLFLSGNGLVAFGGLASRLKKIMSSSNEQGVKGKGTFALILWKNGP